MGLWTPHSAIADEPRTVLKCLVPGCGRQFPETAKRQFEKHVNKCAKRNMDAIQQLVEDRRSSFTEPDDKEMHDWVRREAAEVGGTEANKRLRGRKGR